MKFTGLPAHRPTIRAVTTLCPCGHGPVLTDCCGPLLAAERLADSAVELMRSRYTAYARGDGEHLWRTWDPRTRPERVYLGQETWRGLEIHEVIRGGLGDATGIVSFTARHAGGELVERSLFTRRAGRWFYTGIAGDIEGT